MAAVFAFHTGKTVLQIAAIDHLSLQGLPIRVTLYFRS